MILAIKTDQPEAEIDLLQGSTSQRQKKWLAGRELSKQLLPEIEKLVGGWEKVEGIVIFAGPGSFTGLRIGHTIANALAYGLNIPMVSSGGENWIENGLKKLASAKPGQTVVPRYGAPAKITLPKAK